MAPLSLLSSRPSISPFDAPLSSYKNCNNKCIGQRAVCCTNDVGGRPRIRGEHSRAKRRDVLLRIVLPALFSPAAVTNALGETDAPEGFRVYTDDDNKFMMLIPQDWLVGAGEPSGFRSVTAFYPEAASTSNVSIVITGLGADYTRLESFGKVDAFAENLVNGLDRSWQRPPGVAAKLIDCKSSDGLYYIEYSLQKPGESCRHIYSAIGMATNGWYNRLYTVTGQFLEEDTVKFSPAIQKAVASFKFI